MSLGVVIVEARQDGGAMITARLATEYGREVFAVAGPVHAKGSEGPHALVRDGARLVTSARDVLEDLGLSFPRSTASWTEDAQSAPTPSLSPDERRVLEVLQAEPSSSTASPGLRHAGLGRNGGPVRLELAGLASRHPGARFARTVGGPEPFSVT